MVCDLLDALHDCQFLHLAHGVGECILYLHLNVQNARPALLLNVLYRRNAGAVAVAAKRRVLNEALLCDQVVELLLGHEVVLDAILLRAARVACGVGDTEAEAVRVVFEEALENGRLAGARGAGYDNCAGRVGGCHCGGCGVCAEEWAFVCGQDEGRLHRYARVSQVGGDATCGSTV